MAGNNEAKFKQIEANILAAMSACYARIRNHHGLERDNLTYDGIISIFWRQANERFKGTKAGSH